MATLKPQRGEEPFGGPGTFALLFPGLLVDSGLGRECKLEGSREPCLVWTGISENHGISPQLGILRPEIQKLEKDFSSQWVLGQPFASESPQKGLGVLCPTLLFECPSRYQDLVISPLESVARANKTKSASGNRVEIPKFPQRRTHLVGLGRVLSINWSKTERAPAARRVSALPYGDLNLRMSASMLPWCPQPHWIDARHSDHFCSSCSKPWASLLWFRAIFPFPSPSSHRV